MWRSQQRVSSLAWLRRSVGEFGTCQLVSVSQWFLALLVMRIEKDIASMESSQGHDFTEYPTLRCAGLLGGLEAILRTHPECVETKRTYRAVLKRVFQIYRQTLSVVADAEINDHGEEEEDGEVEDMKSLLSKGPVQAIPEGSSASGEELLCVMME